MSNVSSVSNNNTNYTNQTSNNTDNKAVETKADENKTADKESGVVYTPGTEKDKKTTYKPDTKTIQMLKEDAERRTQQLRSLVEKMMNEQFGKAMSVEDIFTKLRNGEFTVDKATSDQAAKDIAEDGYWGVEQTSERMVSFAKALTGGDPSKIDSMVAAFQKGYDAAIKIMGGKDKAPEITKQTYDATMKKFEAWKNEGIAS